MYVGEAPIHNVYYTWADIRSMQYCAAEGGTYNELTCSMCIVGWEIPWTLLNTFCEYEHLIYLTNKWSRSSIKFLHPRGNTELQSSTFLQDLPRYLCGSVTFEGVNGDKAYTVTWGRKSTFPSSIDIPVNWILAWKANYPFGSKKHLSCDIHTSEDKSG